jgi:hypothetical protein
MEGNLKLLVLKRARQRLVRGRVDADRARHLGVAALTVVLSVSIMQVEQQREVPILVQPARKLHRIGEEIAVPRVATVARLVRWVLADGWGADSWLAAAGRLA